MLTIDGFAPLPGMNQPVDTKRILCTAAPEASVGRKQPVFWGPLGDTVSGSNESHDHDVTRLVPSIASSQRGEPAHLAPARSNASAESPASACSDGSQDSTRASSQERRPRAPDPICGEPGALSAQLAARRKTQRHGADPAAGKWGPGGVKTPPTKKGRMTWSPELHRQFLAALTTIGLRAAVPKTIMQKMQCTTLTRENVASHLQKYRLFLKRQARVTDAAVTSEADWSLLEAAHDSHIADLQPPLLLGDCATPGANPVAAPAHAAAQPPALVRISTATPGVGESDGMDNDSKPTSLRAPACGLPPMLPASAPSPPVPTGTTAMQRAQCGLPPGFAMPGPNAEGEAIGIPMPFHMFTASSCAAVAPDVSRQASAGCKAELPAFQNASGSAATQLDVLPPLALPANPASLMPAAFEPGKMSQRLGEFVATSNSTTLAQPAVRMVQANAGTPMCTVYMVDPAALNGSARTRAFLAPANVPHSMLEVSVAAYNMRGEQRDGPVCGSPARANSSGSASRRNRDSGDADTGTSGRGRVRRRRTGRRSPRPVAGGGCRAVRAHENAQAGNLSALDMLAEVAGRLSGGSG